MSEPVERLWCTACGTVTRDRICDCNRWHNEMSREPNFVNYADAMQETAHEQAQRIEALEKHKRLQMEDVMNLGAALGQAQVRIETLEAALKEAGEMWVRKDNRIEQLEAALREIYMEPSIDEAHRIANDALAPEQEK